MDDIRLAAPGEFSMFPYSRPYLIQADLMRHIYSAIEHRSIAIVESPTGTGKTLSLLTGTLTWLRDDACRIKSATLESLRRSLNNPEDPEWVTFQTFKRLKDDMEAEERDFEAHLADLRSREEASRKSHDRATKKPRVENLENSRAYDSDDDALLPDTKDSDGQENRVIFSYVNGEKRPAPSSTKIFFASRTHSQLSQVINELLKLKLDFNCPIGAGDDCKRPDTTDHRPRQSPRSVSLASRKHLCINELLRARTSDLDEGCRELLSGRQEERCPYVPPLGEEHRLHDFRDRILASPKDIEDLVTTGKEVKLCPYFSSRAAIESAELVTLPYNLLLHERSREALGLNLQDHVVVIDEAHNLIDALLQLHTVELSLSTLHLATEQLTAYLNRFRTRLNTVNAIHLKRLSLFLRALHQFAGRAKADSVMSVSTFVEGMGNKVNGVNLLELQCYMRSSKIARKVGKYSEKLQDNNEAESWRNPSSMHPLHTVEAFLEKLTNGTEDGVITVSGDLLSSNERFIKYQHLNPATYFEDVTRSARSVILAGGTMSPISDMRLQLFPNIPNDKLSVFSCGHVIPPSNVTCLVLGSGPRGKELEFRLRSREDPTIIDELGHCLVNLANICPNGIVIFFPSYSFLHKVRRDWSANDVLNRLQQKKQVFYEPNESAEVDDILQRYAVACMQTSGATKGALLFAVVGAKLSEGLNFANELARAVVLVGIPYPNVASPELRERINYVRKHKGGAIEEGVDPGNELYENLAIRAVNQSIGRAIRHQHDWSALILVDKRYKSQKVQRKLPEWIRQSLLVTQGFGQSIKLLGEFYRAKRTS